MSTLDLEIEVSSDEDTETIDDSRLDETSVSDEDMSSVMMRKKRKNSTVRWKLLLVMRTFII